MVLSRSRVKDATILSAFFDDYRVNVVEAPTGHHKDQLRKMDVPDDYKLQIKELNPRSLGKLIGKLTEGVMQSEQNDEEERQQSK